MNKLMPTVYSENLNMFLHLRTCDPSQGFPSHKWAKVLQVYFRATLETNQVTLEASLSFIDFNPKNFPCIERNNNTT